LAEHLGNIKLPFTTVVNSENELISAVIEQTCDRGVTVAAGGDVDLDFWDHILQFIWQLTHVRYFQAE
jgi:hypothetical protein